MQFSFSRPVYNLTFNLTDIDSNTNQFIDGAAITGVGFSAVPVSTVSGAGTLASPWRQVSAANPVDNSTSSAGNVAITMAGPVNTFTLTYWNVIPPTPSITPAQAIFVSQMKFSAFNAGCP